MPAPTGARTAVRGVGGHLAANGGHRGAVHGWTRGAQRRTVAGVGTLGDAVDRNLAARAARGLPETINDPAVWRIVANVLAQHAAEREKAAMVETMAARLRDAG